MNNTVELTIELGISGVITPSDIFGAKRLVSGYDKDLTLFVNKFLTARNQSAGVNIDVVHTIDNPPLNFKYDANSVILKVSGNVNTRARRAYIETAITCWFSPVRTGFENHQYLRYRSRLLPNMPSGASSTIRPPGISDTTPVFVINNIVVNYEG